MERNNLTTRCPVCGGQLGITVKQVDGFYGFLDYTPPMKCAEWSCNECGIKGYETDDMGAQNSDLIEKVQKKLTMNYSQSIIEKTGRLALLHLGPDLKWREILGRFKSPQFLTNE